MSDAEVEQFRMDIINGNFTDAVERLYSLPAPKAVALASKALEQATRGERLALRLFFARHEHDAGEMPDDLAVAEDEREHDYERVDPT